VARLLVDSHVLLWHVQDDPRLGPGPTAAIEADDAEVFVSIAGLWEIAIKSALGKLKLPKSADAYVPDLRARLGIESLPIDEESALHLSRLPALHRDPFDRLLVCQAIVHGMVLLTPDPGITQYPARTSW